MLKNTIINTIKHMALALVAGIALAGAAHAQTAKTNQPAAAAKKEQEPIFTGRIEDFDTLVDQSGGSRNYILLNAGKQVVLEGEFESFYPSIDDWNKKFVGFNVEIRSKPKDILGTKSTIGCMVNDRASEPMLRSIKQGQSIRVAGEISQTVPLRGRASLVKCQVL